MEILKDRYSITELSQRLNVTDHALRYYEKEFGITVPKDDRGRRYYTTDLANLMYQIKAMRDDGLEIKAIKKILLSENIIGEPPPVVLDDGSVSLTTTHHNDSTRDIRVFFEEFKEQLTENLSIEINSSREYLSREITKSKLELGACVENSVRKLEAKMERHFQDVDEAIGLWRERRKKSFFKRLMDKK
mgnify:CR=1 FL=1